MIAAFLPVTTAKYWYFTAYLGMYLFSPFLVYAINNMPRHLVRNLLFCILAVFCILPTILNRDPFWIHSGYSTLWLIVLFMVGAYIKKYNVLQSNSKRMLFLLYTGAVIIVWLIKYASEFLCFSITGTVQIQNLFISYTSPLILAEAVALVLLFSKLQFSAQLSKLIGKVAPAAFGVYLLHAHPLIWIHLLQDYFLSFGELSTAYFYVRSFCPQ